MRDLYFDYRVSIRLRGIFPGVHVGQMVGGGQFFKRYEPLIASPDPRRLDLRASILDPFRQFNVRVFRQNTQLTVFLLADFSASMSFIGAADKQKIMLDCLYSIAESVWRAGDKFGFVGCGETISSSLHVHAATDNRYHVELLAEKLRKTRLTGNARAIPEAHRYLPRQSSLVFVLSDFHDDCEKIGKVIQSLRHHVVVPLVLWDQQEFRQLPEWGGIRFRDMESGKMRTLWLRPALKRKIIAAFDTRRERLTRLFRANGAEPMFLDNGYDPMLLTQYFLRQANR